MAAMISQIACRDCGYPDPRALRRWRPRQTKPWATILLCRKCHARKSAQVRAAGHRADLAAIQARVSARFTHAKVEASKPLAMLIGVSLASPPSPGFPAQPKGTNMRTHYLVAGVLAVALAALASFPAHAALTISANFGGSIFTCVDNAACDTNLSTGTIQIADTTLGGLTINGSIQTSVGTLANPNALDILNTSSLSVINTLAGPVAYIVTVSDTGFKAPVAPFSTASSAVWQNAGGSTATVKFWADAANAQGATTPTTTPGTLIDSFTSTAVGPADSFAHNGSGSLLLTSPFSMTEQISGTLTGNATLLNRGQTEIFSPVPEPASMTILGAGLIGLVALRRKLSA
jgi:hypothetical protein